jgi:hypothetical protein
LTIEHAEKDTERQLELGITCETVAVYRYKQHSYSKLSDALNYAEIDVLSNDPDPEALT